MTEPAAPVTDQPAPPAGDAVYDPLTELLHRIKDRTAKVAIVGQGYVGLPVAMRAAELGFPTIGYEIDAQRCGALQAGESYVEDVPDEMLLARPSPDTLGLALSFGDESWQPAYGKVDGWLPLADVPAVADKPRYLRADIEVTQPGEVQIVTERQGLAADAWVDGKFLEPSKQNRVSLERGRHSLLLRLPHDAKAPALRVIVERPEGSAAEYAVVGGP